MKRIVMMVFRLGVLSIYYFITLCIKSNAKVKNFDENYQLISKITKNVNNITNSCDVILPTKVLHFYEICKL